MLFKKVFFMIKFYIFRISTFKNKIINFFKRGKNGFCFEDVYELNSWFVEIMPKMLKVVIEQRYAREGEFPKMSALLEMCTCFNEASSQCSYENKYEGTFTTDLKFLPTENSDLKILTFVHDKPENFEKYCEEDEVITEYKKIHLTRALELFVENFYELFI